MGSTSHIIERINRIYPTLHPAEKQVAAFVRSSLDVIGSLTVGQLAEQCEVSQPTVIRFARKLGFNGYREFRYAVAHPATSLESADDTAFNPLEGFNLHPWDNPDDVPHKTVAAATTILNEMLGTLDIKAFRRAVTQIAKARVIDIYAVEDSLAPAADLNVKLSYLGLQCRLHQDPYLQQISASHLTPADLAVAISYSGSSSDTVKALRLAKNQGAATLGITNNAGTPVANWADVTLLAGRDSHTIYGNAIFSRISHSAVVDMLYMGVILTDYTRYASVLDASGRAISDRAFQPGNAAD
ncbi:MurR/RpiR family transcriptional regulator [Bifidobacterium vespertilionis]|uniref:MurR/RpiR family transcriptional regulator n=1 Tax=Bifidobacterium vespertilionis TaxID=2562524 RepID=A0A5J5E338_9BIFI|nr:MurR/RpiR family transcriptional regulator [Bifidobacterium vespertilionis]KAA8822009.1 MurR/RpiR family transcriptional regulator [Bifidobacterium vespertilionis]KAA8823550.1 MurR/RpiR family transcriptional regulator [Bifidobacterium vespertilionis]MBT1179539.1 MurR/RpiR family transcriptional regulator [Bifidobacterium vespertilionis]